MSNPFKAGDKVTVKADAMNTPAAQDCTQGKEYQVTHVGMDSTKEFAALNGLPVDFVVMIENNTSEENVSFTDDAGDFVTFFYEEVELA